MYRKLNDEFENKLSVDETVIAQKVIQEIYDGVKTSELDELSSQTTVSMYSKHPQIVFELMLYLN